MSPRRPRRLCPPLVVAVALAQFAALLASPAGAVATPSVRLFVASTHLTVERNRRDHVFVDPAAYITPVGKDFKLIVNRPDYDTPVTAKQVDPDSGLVLRTFSDDRLDGWRGLADFAHLRAVDRHGDVVARRDVRFCPHGDVRLSDDGPLTPSYRHGCYSYNPFTRGMVWGLDIGWANALGGRGFGWKGTGDAYTVRIRIDREWADLLEIAPGDAIAKVVVTVVDRGNNASRPYASSGPAVSAEAIASAPSSRTPIVTQPDPATLPDFIALPAWGFSVSNRPGHSYLNFGATEWNAGPGPMVVDGFRGDAESTMDAYQYFLLDGEAVGRALIGQLEYVAGRHDHWHLEDFIRYSLLDADKNTVQVSSKESWCLVPTDAIDLSVLNAASDVDAQDLYSSCNFHEPSSLWVREALPVGWGDTYDQYLNGGGFDISDLPKGRYYVRIEVNPGGSIFEASSANDTEDRLIRLRGKPGQARHVVVPPWHGIDTDPCDYYC